MLRVLLALTGPARAFVDGDEDGAPDEIEPWFGTDPTRADTDGDGLLDGDDALPLDPDAGDVTAGFDPRCRRSAPLTDPEFDEPSRGVVFDLDRDLYFARVLADGTTGTHHLLDRGLGFPGATRNGPEWIRDAGGPRVLYTLPGPEVWIADPATGEVQPVGNGLPPAFGPIGTEEPGDPDPWITYLSPAPGGGAEAWVRRLAGTGAGLYVGPADDRLGALRFAANRLPDEGHALLGVREVSGATEIHELDLGDPQPVWKRMTFDRLPKYQAHGWRDPVSGLDLYVTTHLADLDGDGGLDGPARVAVYERDTGLLFQVLPTQPRMPYVVSPEPIVAADGRSYVVFLGSTHRENLTNGYARVYLGEVGRAGDRPRPDLLFRRVDDLGDLRRRLKDPEGYTHGGTETWIYVTDFGRNLLLTCLTGL